MEARDSRLALYGVGMTGGTSSGGGCAYALGSELQLVATLNDCEASEGGGTILAESSAIVMQDTRIEDSRWGQVARCGWWTPHTVQAMDCSFVRCEAGAAGRRCVDESVMSMRV